MIAPTSIAVRPLPAARNVGDKAIGCLHGCPGDHHEDDCGARQPAADSGHCCTALGLDGAAAAARQGLRCGSGHCARRALGMAS